MITLTREQADTAHAALLLMIADAMDERADSVAYPDELERLDAKIADARSVAQSIKEQLGD